MDISLIDWNKFMPGSIKKMGICSNDSYVEIANVANVNVDYKGRIIIKEGKNVGGNSPTILYEVTLKDEQKTILWDMYEARGGVKDIPRMLNITIGIDYNDETFSVYPCVVETVPDMLINKYTGSNRFGHAGIIKITVYLENTSYSSMESLADLVKEVNRKAEISQEKREILRTEIEARQEKSKRELEERIEKSRIAKEKARIVEEMMFLRKSIICEVVDLVQEVKDIENAYGIYDLMDIEDD